MVRFLFAIMILLFSRDSCTPEVTTEESGRQLFQAQCLVSAVWHEARGEPVKGKRAVLEVIENRAKMYDLSYCDVVAKKQQFPWYEKKGLVALTPETLRHYNQAIAYGPVLNSENFIYFNGIRPHGVGCRKIGKHIFCKEKK